TATAARARPSASASPPTVSPRTCRTRWRAALTPCWITSTRWSAATTSWRRRRAASSSSWSVCRRAQRSTDMTLYLDHAATTPVRAAVIERMTEVMKHHGANPASSHGPGRDAAAVVDRAAAEVAACIGACGDEIVWTSGATEAINLALKGVCGFHGGGHVISVVTEHSATLDTLDWLERGGVAVTRLAVDRDGLLDLAALAAALRADTRCVSVMHVNNETGVMQDLAAIGALCAEHGVTLHVD